MMGDVKSNQEVINDSIIESLSSVVGELSIVLAESLWLQSRYAEQLNVRDGGERRTFDSPESWIKRLREIGRLP
jgi:hypothetical protein